MSNQLNGNAAAALHNQQSEPAAKESYSIKELADLVQGDIEGDDSLMITGVQSLGNACAGDISFLANIKYTNDLDKTQASVVVVGKEEVIDVSVTLLRVQNPNYAFAKIADYVQNKPIKKQQGVHPTAIIGENVSIGKNVSIHAHVVICDHAEIGDNTVIQPFTYIGHYSTLGKDCLVYPHVTIRERCLVGDRVIIHSGVVIGCDGFGYSTIKGVHEKIPQIGIVEIGDDVEIGANTAIDRARFERTVVGNGTKIDNLVQIGHNVQTGQHCLIIGQTGIAGSAKLGNYVVLAGQCGVNGHITVGNNVQAMGGTGILRNTPDNARLGGVPAQPADQYLRTLGHLKKFGTYVEEIKQLKNRIEDLEKKTTDDSANS